VPPKWWVCTACGADWHATDGRRPCRDNHGNVICVACYVEAGGRPIISTPDVSLYGRPA